MTFDEEWAAARTAAAANVSMRLNHVPADPGNGGGGDLELNQDHIGAVGSEAFKLHERLFTDGKHAKVATAEAASALSKENLHGRRAWARSLAGHHRNHEIHWPTSSWPR